MTDDGKKSLSPEKKTINVIIQSLQRVLSLRDKIDHVKKSIECKTLTKAFITNSTDKMAKHVENNNVEEVESAKEFEAVKEIESENEIGTEKFEIKDEGLLLNHSEEENMRRKNILSDIIPSTTGAGLRRESTRENLHELFDTSFNEMELNDDESKRVNSPEKKKKRNEDFGPIIDEIDNSENDDKENDPNLLPQTLQPNSKKTEGENLKQTARINDHRVKGKKCHCKSKIQFFELSKEDKRKRAMEKMEIRNRREKELRETTLREEDEVIDYTKEPKLTHQDIYELMQVTKEKIKFISKNSNNLRRLILLHMQLNTCNEYISENLSSRLFKK